MPVSSSERAKAKRTAISLLLARRNAAIEQASAMYERYGGQRAMGWVDGYDYAIKVLTGTAND